MTKPIDEFIKESKKICDEATPGPWWNSKLDISDFDHIVMDYPTIKYNNVIFIGKSRDALPKALKALEEAVDALEEIDLTDHDCGIDGGVSLGALMKIESILGDK